MKVISWNLNHRTLEKPIPPQTLVFFERFSPDLIVLNEYVERSERSGFRSQLMEAGWCYQEVSEARGKHNRILVAARFPLEKGDLAPPDLTDAAVSNFLHLYLPEQKIDLIGLRAPCYQSSSEKSAYWRQVAERIDAAGERRLLMLGDFNYDPFSGLAQDIDGISFRLCGRYRIPNPEGDWSYISVDGSKSSRIDHLMVSEELCVNKPCYLTEYKGIRLAGSRLDRAISDHAVLALELES